MAGKGISKGAMWVLMGLLIVGLGGFGVTNLSGRVHSIGSVGDAEIDITTYARALQNEIRALEAQRGESLSFAQARAAGVDQQVLGQLVSRAALEHETARLGISVGDAVLRDEILAISAFSGLDGSFDREAYAFALQQAGLNEAEFEANIRAETAATLLQAAAVAGIQAPPAYMDTMITYLGERRSLAFATLDRSDLASGLPVPSEEDLRSYHQSHLPDFTTPETKSITYARVTPEMIVDTVEVPEDALRRAYDERSAEFNQPERRLVERLVYSDPERAENAKARLEDGVFFEMLVAERGLEMSDVDMGDVSAGDLGAAADAVFSADPGDIVGPVGTSLGPALFRINGVLSAQVTPFEEAKPQLRETLARDRASRVIDTMSERVDDLLAGGATLEDVARETELQLGTVDWHAGLAEGIAGYAAFRSAAEAVQEGDYPAVERMEDGGIFTLRLDGIDEPRILPLSNVREAVRQGWREQATADALAAQVAPQLEELRNGAAFADLGLEATEITGMTRRDYRADAPPEFIERVFLMEEGEVQVIEGEGRIFVLRLDEIAPPAENDEEMSRLRTALRDQVAADLGQDIFQILANDIRARAGVDLDQTALNAVHANFN